MLILNWKYFLICFMFLDDMLCCSGYLVRHFVLVFANYYCIWRYLIHDGSQFWYAFLFFFLSSITTSLWWVILFCSLVSLLFLIISYYEIPGSSLKPKDQCLICVRPGNLSSKGKPTTHKTSLTIQARYGVVVICWTLHHLL